MPKNEIRMQQDITFNPGASSERRRFVLNVTSLPLRLFSSTSQCSVQTNPERNMTPEPSAPHNSAQTHSGDYVVPEPPDFDVLL